MIRAHSGLQPVLLGLLLALFLVPAASAKECRAALEELFFCAEGTAWETVRPQLEYKDGKVKNMVWYGPEVVLILSRMPTIHAKDLPRRPEHGDMAEAAARLLDLYSGSEELETFSPLGQDVPAATIAFRDKGAGWLNVITYYAIGDARLSVQTGKKHGTGLTDTHRQLHIEAVGALSEVEK